MSSGSLTRSVKKLCTAIRGNPREAPLHQSLWNQRIASFPTICSAKNTVVRRFRRRPSKIDLREGTEMSPNVLKRSMKMLCALI